MKIKTICQIFFFVTLLQASSFLSIAQNTVYTALYNSSNFVKTIDFSKPVGEIGGSVSATSSGGVTYTIPIFTCPGTNGLQPSISLSYSSQAGAGVVGYGWNITGLSSIIRTGKNKYHNAVVTPVTYTFDDAFLLDGMRLNQIAGNFGIDERHYTQESESFSTIVSNAYGNPNGPSSFVITSKDGTVMEYGETADSRIYSAEQSYEAVMMWRMNKITDINGNYIEFKYNNIDRDSRIEQISYTGNSNTGLMPYNQVNFSYSKRADKNTVYDAGSLLATHYLLDKISVIHTNDVNVNETVKTYRLNYGFDNVNSMLKEIEEFGGDESAASLNSTIFLYGDQPTTNLVTEPTALFLGECITGDFNADGKTDILASTYYYEDQIKYTSGYKIMLNPQSTNFLYEKVLPPGQTIPENKKFVNFMTSDFNKDGRDDVVNIKTQFVTYPSGYAERKLENITFEFTTNTGSFTQQMPTPVDKVIHTSGNFFIPGDFDGDGNQDYITMLGSPSGNGSSTTYTARLCTPSGYIANTQILTFTVTPATDYTAKSVVISDKILPLDFDGDGKQEVLVVKGTQTSILRISTTNNANYYSASIILTTNDIVSDDKVFSGDFNGDRKADLLVKKANGQWKIFYSDGVGFRSVPFFFNQPVVFNGSSGDNKIIVADFNGDGKSDILHGFNVVSPNGPYYSSSKFSMYYSTGMNNPFYYEQNDYNKTLPLTDLATGDFNGDGSTDILLKREYNQAGDIVYFKPYNQQKLLQKITTGHNITTTIVHTLMTSNNPSVYSRDIALDNPLNQAPFNYIRLPMYLLSSISNPDGVGGINITEYFYKDALMHRLGKGFLGFKKIFTSNNVIGNTSITENEFNTQFAVPYTVKQSIIRTLTQELLSETLISNTFQNLSINGLDKRYFQKIDKTLSIDYFNDKATESINTYDNFGNVVNNIMKIGILNGNTVNATETIENVSIFSIHNTPVPAKPDNITISKTRTGMPTVTATNAFTYTYNGLRATETSFSGLPKAVTTAYTYNDYGNPISITTSTQGLNNRYASTVYDLKGRFVISTNKSGQGVSQSETFVVNKKFGNVLQHTTSDCLTFTNSYDAFGKITNSVAPDESTTTISLIWQTTDLYGSPNPNKLFYTFNHFSGGKPDTKTYINKFGQEWRQETMSMYGAAAGWHTIGTTYDYRGNVKTKTNLYFPAILNPPSNPSYIQPVETPRITTYDYDNYNRVSKVSNDVGDVLYNYTTLGNGKNKITVTNLAGQVTAQITDETGKIVSSIDNGGQLDFFYDSRENQVAVKREGTTLVNSVFDVYGKQTSTTDINAGKTIYDYDAYGQLRKQVDPLGNTTDLIYDDFGRIVTRIGAEGTTTYDYYQDASSGCSNDNLKNVTSFNGAVKAYTFDALKRITTETQTVDGIASTKSYFYNNFGRVVRTLYPSGLNVFQNYDDIGYLRSVYHTEPLANNFLYKNGWVDGEGKYLTYGLGVDKVTTNTYNKDYLANTVTTGIRNLSYNFNLQTGNLMQRSSNLINQVEDFSYDNLNRLITGSPNNIIQTATTYDEYTSQNGTGSIGNIDTKTDAGYYKYKSDKINALAYIMNTPVPNQNLVTPSPNTNISYLPQEISYTPFLKAASIGESANTGGSYLEYTYGYDYERVKSHLTYGHGNYETKYYFEDYEKQIVNGKETEIHYINGGNGLCAIIVKEVGTFSTNIVYTDHLGSITTVTNFDGSAIVAEQSFDAWGRNRNPYNWNDYNYYNVTLQTPKWLYRGYTGHEMLPEFSLINMNGRIYDPVIGRMLSPDNLVPAPYSTQGYNRYTYAYNNPLSYTDPDGNEPITAAILIGAALGGYFAGVSANGGQFNPLKWSNPNTISFVVGGAIIGAVSGYVGGTAAASGLPFSNTVGIITSSFTNSVGMSILFGGQMPPTISLGFASVNLQSGEFNYLGKKGNSFLTNLGYGFGALANLQDLVAGFKGTDVQVNADVTKHDLTGHSSLTNDAGTIDISVASKHGVYGAGGAKTAQGSLGREFEYIWNSMFKRHAGRHYTPHHQSGSNWAITIRNVRQGTLENMTSNLAKGNGMWGGTLRYGFGFGCMNHVAKSLLSVGIPTLPINFHPYILNLQLATRQAGIFASPYLINR
jgi:RHS repeat-associated protein